MARPRPRPPRSSAVITSPRTTAVARRPSATRTTAVAVVLTDWRDDAVVVRLTAKVHDLMTVAGRRSAQAVVAIGRHLRSIRDRVPRGTWLQWVEDNASFGRSTAANYIALAEWSEREPATYGRLEHLGPGKLYVLSAAPRERVRGLKAGKAVPVPGSARHKTIEAMTTLELASVIGDLETPDIEAVRIEKVVQTVRYKVAALATAADALVERADEVDEDVVRTIRDDLVNVLAQIEGVLG